MFLRKIWRKSCAKGRIVIWVAVQLAGGSGLFTWAVLVVGVRNPIVSAVENLLDYAPAAGNTINLKQLNYDKY